MRPYYLEQTTVGASNPIPLDWRQIYVQISIGVAFLDSVTGATYSVEYTLDPITDPTYTGTPTWIKFNDATEKTTAVNFSLLSPVIAIRLNVSTLTTGTLRLQIVTTGSH